jgi:hypothetical protein
MPRHVPRTELHNILFHLSHAGALERWLSLGGTARFGALCHRSPTPLRLLLTTTAYRAVARRRLFAVEIQIPWDSSWPLSTWL